MGLSVATTKHIRHPIRTEGQHPADRDSCGRNGPIFVGIWTSQATGIGAQQLNWTVSDGPATIVVMNAVGSAVVNATAGLRAGMVLPLALTLLGVGLLMTAGGVVLITLASRRRV